jgi:hypothetical protein
MRSSRLAVDRNPPSPCIARINIAFKVPPSNHPRPPSAIPSAFTTLKPAHTMHRGGVGSSGRGRGLKGGPRPSNCCGIVPSHPMQFTKSGSSAISPKYYYYKGATPLPLPLHLFLSPSVLTVKFNSSIVISYCSFCYY